MADCEAPVPTETRIDTPEEREEESTPLVRGSTFNMHWIDTIYLARALQITQAENKLGDQPFTHQMSLTDNFSKTDASIPPINTFFLWDPNKEAKSKDSPEKVPRYLFHTLFPSVETFMSTPIDTHEYFYDTVIEPLYQHLFSEGKIKGEYPDANNYRAALIEAVKAQRAKDEPLQYQILAGHGDTPRKIMFITEDEIILFPIMTEGATPYTCLFIDPSTPTLYTPLTTFQRFSLPARLLE